MRNPNEIFTYPLDNDSDNAQEAVNYYNCRFTGKICDKQSRMINYPMGVCSVNHSGKKPIICPNRFLEDNIVFTNICISAFGSTDNVLLFKEVRLKDVGTFDFVLVKHKPISSEVEDFCIVEFQSDSTTGTGKLVNALKDFMNGDDLKNKNYSFGMNTYNTIKLSYIQMLIKGQVMESWDKKIFWVMQDFVFDNMVDRFNLADLDYTEEDNTKYHIYDLELKDNLYNLKLIRKKSTTISNLIKAFTHQPTPSIDSFINKLEEKIELKLGLSFK
ncbi:restriction endonuclease NotI [Lutibacter oceani]|uniref:Restriction endonuclease NotI n=1 Tax=Lutibacter oceani TaxID=1853311 RepID=A0A3D9RQC6_9FLAO|nr:NotI family restriction endonuclease [Lutibacter oceani]REE82143.1 restriction endonuclease NotI [Lutibacter oceani]